MLGAPPVAPVALRVEKYPVTDASLVEVRSWPLVGGRGEEPEV